MLSIQEQAEITAALAIGETVQCRRDASEKWTKVDERHMAAGLNFRAFQYRIKPEPVVVFLNHYSPPDHGRQWSLAFETPEEAAASAEGFNCDRIALPFRYMTNETETGTAPDRH
jgi:hypothetical protein